MSDEMGSFRVAVEIENPLRPGERRTLPAVLVDTGAEFSWIPSAVLESLGITRVKKLRFRQADGSVLERWAGEVRLYVAGARTIDEAVFGDPDDLTVLGSHSLEGFNLTIDPVNKRLIDAGPILAALAGA